MGILNLFIFNLSNVHKLYSMHQNQMGKLKKKGTNVRENKHSLLRLSETSNDQAFHEPGKAKCYTKQPLKTVHHTP